MSHTAVRIRGIYATSLTALCRDHDIDIVDPSSVIEDRFDLGDVDGYPTVTMTDTRDRMGVMMSGDPTAVDEIATLIDAISADTFTGTTRLARGMIAGGTVTETTDSGAIVDVANETAFLPYRLSDEYVSRGDRLAVQVIEPEAPWTMNRRPVVAARPHVIGRYLTLVRDPDAPMIESPDRELHGLLELLDPAIPDDWSLQVAETAHAVDLAILEEDLEHVLSDRSRVVEAMRNARDPATPGGVYAPEATAWGRIGRGGRFELDEKRTDVSRTIPGHHRLKVVGNGAGSAVEYLERLAVDIPFEPDAVFDSFGPRIEDRVSLRHGKPDGSCIGLGTGTVTARPQPAAITVERQLTPGGTLDALDVPIEQGDRAETTYVEGQRWAPTVYRDDDDNRKGTYVNINTPIEIFPDRVCYTDLFIDVIKDADGSVWIVDEDELDAAHSDDLLSDQLVNEARTLAQTLKRSLIGTGSSEH